MRYALLATPLLLFSIPAFGQELYTFSTQVKSGDVFTRRTLQVQTARLQQADEKPVFDSTETTTIERRVTVVEAEAGRAMELDETTLKHASRLGSAATGFPAGDPEIRGPLEGVTLRYERSGASFKPRLLKGELKPIVASRLKDSESFPLKDNLLPSKPLAVGGSETIAEPDRLDPMFHELSDKQRWEYREPPRFTLEKVETIDGVKTAILSLTIAARTRNQAAGTKGKAPGTIDYQATIRYDLDHSYVRRIDAKERIKSLANVNNTPGSATVDVVIEDEFRKQ